KNAVTNFRVLKRYKTTTLLECFLETGRTHQIRVHMKYINHPIVNDPVYGKANKNNDFGQMLHAVEIEFVHPTTLERLKFTSNLPEKFKSILDQYKE
ncbi:MAG: pseudouridine synthase, partial [Bacilli bacterium]